MEEREIRAMQSVSGIVKASFKRQITSCLTHARLSGLLVLMSAMVWGFCGCPINSHAISKTATNSSSKRMKKQFDSSIEG